MPAASTIRVDRGLPFISSLRSSRAPDLCWWASYLSDLSLVTFVARPGSSLGSWVVLIKVWSFCFRPCLVQTCRMKVRYDQIGWHRQRSARRKLANHRDCRISSASRAVHSTHSLSVCRFVGIVGRTQTTRVGWPEFLSKRTNFSTTANSWYRWRNHFSQFLNVL